MYQSIAIKKVEIAHPSDHYHHLAAIFDHLETPLDPAVPIQRWEKCVIPGDITLRSRMSEEVGRASRSSRYFEAQGKSDSDEPVFEEALVFYSLQQADIQYSLVVYHKLLKTHDVYERWCGRFSEDLEAMESSRLIKLVGIWKYEERVHVLRRHVGLDLLDQEYGMEEQREL